MDQNCWWNDDKNRLNGRNSNVLDDDMDNNSNGEDDRCRKEKDGEILAFQLIQLQNPYNIFLGYWDAAYASGGSTPVGAFVLIEQ